MMERVLKMSRTLGTGSLLSRVFAPLTSNERIEEYRRLHEYNDTHEDYDVDAEARAYHKLTALDRLRLSFRESMEEYKFSIQFANRIEERHKREDLLDSIFGKTKTVGPNAFTTDYLDAIQQELDSGDYGQITAQEVLDRALQTGRIEFVEDPTNRRTTIDSLEV